MTTTFKALCALLTYPGDDLIAALPDIRALLDDERRLRAPCGARSPSSSTSSP